MSKITLVSFGDEDGIPTFSSLGLEGRSIGVVSKEEQTPREREERKEEERK